MGVKELYLGMFFGFGFYKVYLVILWVRFLFLDFFLLLLGVFLNIEFYFKKFLIKSF